MKRVVRIRLSFRAGGVPEGRSAARNPVRLNASRFYARDFSPRFTASRFRRLEMTSHMRVVRVMTLSAYRITESGRNEG